MSTTFPYVFQPQPPAHPKSSGGKRGPSAPLPVSSSDDEECEPGTGHSPTSPAHPPASDVSASRLTDRLDVAAVSSIPASQNHFIAKRRGLATLVSSPVSTCSNNLTALNLNHVIPSTNGNHLLVTTTNSNNSNNASSSNSNENITVGLTTINNNNNNSDITSSVINIHPHSTSSVLPATTVSTAEQSNINVTGNQAIISTLCDVNSDNNTSTSLTKNTSISNKEEVADSPSSPSSHTLSPASSFAYEHDHDYDSVGSPCSSTASGPVYVRPPGFGHHAQEIEAPHTSSKLKKKKKVPASLVSLREGCKRREATPPKQKTKRDPLPMKLRALPQSFWQQPNVAHQVSPATLFLPPLLQKDSEEALMDIRPVTPTDERDATKKIQVPERRVTVTNTDLLFKLFEGIGEGKKTSCTFKSRAIKARKQVPKSNSKGLFLGNDPYMVDAVVEKIFPQLTLDGSRHSSGGSNTSLQLITLKEGDRTVTLPSLSLDQNYPQMLSELVTHI